jgi:magnesium-transporting ATPase (P-type)
MVTSVYNSQLGGQSTSETTDHIRKRKVIANTGNRARNVNKLVKFKNATLNWLNGLPPTDYDSALHEFNADNFHETENQNEDSDTNMNSTEKAGFKRNLKRFKKLFKSSEKRRELAEAAATAEALQDENLNGSFPDSPFEKVGKVQNLEETQYMEIRPNVREIFLPPDVAGQRKFLRNLTPKMRKKFAESHPWTVSNEIHTAKYTFLNFVPKNLFEQFRRVANVYFLILIILQGIPIFSNTNIFLAASPLFSILLVTAVKDAVEDWKRQKSDNLVNNSLVKVLERADEEAAQDQNSNEKTGSMMQKLKKLFKFSTKNGADAVNEQPDGWKQTFWKDIRVGDIVMILNNDSIPADVIVLSTSDSHGICYVETKNLDGETNLKIRQAPKQTAHMVTAEEVSKLNAVLQVEQPSTKLYTFNGKQNRFECKCLFLFRQNDSSYWHRSRRCEKQPGGFDGC